MQPILPGDCNGLRTAPRSVAGSLNLDVPGLHSSSLTLTLRRPGTGMLLMLCAWQLACGGASGCLRRVERISLTDLKVEVHPLPFVPEFATRGGAGETILWGRDEADRYPGTLKSIKIGSDGRILETERRSVPENLELASICQTPDGGFALLGTERDATGQNGEICIIRAASNFDTVWRLRCCGPGADLAGDIALLPDGGFVVAGATWSSGAGNSDLYLGRISASGSLLWEGRHGGTGFEGYYEHGPHVALAPDGGYVLVGSSDSRALGGTGNVNTLVVKVGADGVKEWERPHGVPGAVSVPGGIVRHKSGGYVICGTRENVDPGVFCLNTDFRSPPTATFDKLSVTEATGLS